MLLGGLAVVSAIAISKPRINGSCSAKWRRKLSDKLKNRENGRKDFFKFPEQSCKVKFAAKNKIKKLEYYAANKQIDLPKSLRTIKAGTFESCGFDQLVIPKSVKSIGKNALQVTTKTLKGKMEYRELEY